MNYIFIGMRGAGKSNVSRRLSILVKRPVFSTDLMIEYENGGKTIPEIIEENNGDWRAFRDMEYQTLLKIAKLDEIILDCGGGVIVDLDEDGNEIFSERKVKALRGCGTIVWLKGDIKKLAAKTKGSEKRPTLDARKSAEEILRHRLPFYEKAADVVVDIGTKKRQIIADEIFEMIKVGKI